MTLDKNEKLNILTKNFNWFSPVRDTRDTVKRAPLEKQNFRADNVDNTENFVRELIQNALDANDKSSPKPVSVEIKTIFIKDENKTLYNNIFSKTIRGFLEDSKDIKKSYKHSYKALIISDFGTTGLDGDIYDSGEDATEEKGSNWLKYFHSVGKGSGTSKVYGLGSANQGKVAIWALSRVWCILGMSKISGGATRFQGKCLLSDNVNLSNTTFRECDAFYRKHDYEFNLDEEEISIFNDIFQIKKREKFELGTDFILLEAHDFEEERVLHSIIQNWSIPIFEGKLEIDINGFFINKFNIENIIQDNHKNLKNISLEFLKFCLRSRAGENIIKYKLKRDLPDKVFEERTLRKELFENEVIEKDLMDKIFDNKIVEIEFQPTIRYKNKREFIDRFSVFITRKSSKDNSENGSQGLMMRMEQILWDEHSFCFQAAKTRDDIYVLIAGRSPRICDLLTHFEVPTHRKFLEKLPDFNNENIPYTKNNAINNLRLFKKSANKTLYFLFDGEIKEDPSFLHSLFPDDLFNNEKSKKKKKKPKDITIPVDGTDPALPPVDLPPSLPKAIRIDQEEGTGNIKISSTNNYVFNEGDKFIITLAADCPEGTGNPFSEYTRYDFDLRKCTVAVEDGCLIEANFNKVEINPFTSSFKVIFEGLHPHWDYVHRYRMITKKIDEEDD